MAGEEGIIFLRLTTPIGIPNDVPGLSGKGNHICNTKLRLTRDWCNSTIGAGDTFIAAMLYGLTCHWADWDIRAKLRFAVDMATLKVQREGFEGLGRDAQGQL